MKENQDAIIRLNNDTSQTEIKTYFTKIFELKQAGKRFPVNLDEVWPLVYSRKDKAVRVLTSDFIEGEDYITQKIDFEPLPQNGERRNNGRFTGANKTDYYLSISCLEYFIAKKVNAVFEVYRSVFHKVVDEQTHPMQRTPEITLGDRLSDLRRLDRVDKLTISEKAAYYAFLEIFNGYSLERGIRMKILFNTVQTEANMSYSSVKRVMANLKDRGLIDFRSNQGSKYLYVSLDPIPEELDYNAVAGEFERSKTTWKKQDLPYPELNYPAKPKNVVEPSLLADICEIEDKDVRMRIVNKLREGGLL